MIKKEEVSQILHNINNLAIDIYFVYAHIDALNVYIGNASL